MDFATIAISTVLTVAVMVALYHGWIIPKVVNGIKEQLPQAIGAEVDRLLKDVLIQLNEYIGTQIGEQGDRILEKFYGKMGNKTRLTKLANTFFGRNGINEETIEDAIERYGQPIVDAILAKSTPVDVGTPDTATPWV